EVRKQRARRTVKHCNPCRLAGIFEGAVAAIAVEAVGEPGGLAHVEVVPAGVINVAHSDAGVSVDVDAARCVQYRPPVVDPSKHLLLVGLDAPERLRCDVNEDGAASAALGLLDRLPLSDAPLARRSAFPFQAPRPDALFAERTRARSHQVVT